MTVTGKRDSLNFPTSDQASTKKRKLGTENANSERINHVPNAQVHHQGNQGNANHNNKNSVNNEVMNHQSNQNDGNQNNKTMVNAEMMSPQGDHIDLTQTINDKQEAGSNAYPGFETATTKEEKTTQSQQRFMPLKDIGAHTPPNFTIKGKISYKHAIRNVNVHGSPKSYIYAAIIDANGHKKKLIFGVQVQLNIKDY